MSVKWKVERSHIHALSVEFLILELYVKLILTVFDAVVSKRQITVWHWEQLFNIWLNVPLLWKLGKQSFSYLPATLIRQFKWYYVFCLMIFFKYIRNLILFCECISRNMTTLQKNQKHLSIYFKKHENSLKFSRRKCYIVDPGSLLELTLYE